MEDFRLRRSRRKIHEMKFDKIKVGDILFDVHSYRMGNTSIRTVGVWPVRILELHPESQSATVSWNHNDDRPRRYFRRDLEKLRAKEPELVEGFFGSMQLARKVKKVSK